MTTSDSGHDVPPPDEDREVDERPADDERGETPPPDPEAPGNFVDDEGAADVPEPNEPA